MLLRIKRGSVDQWISAAGERGPRQNPDSQFRLLYHDGNHFLYENIIDESEDWDENSSLMPSPGVSQVLCSDWRGTRTRMGSNTPIGLAAAHEPKPTGEWCDDEAYLTWTADLDPLSHYPTDSRVPAESRPSIDSCPYGGPEQRPWPQSRRGMRRQIEMDWIILMCPGPVGNPRAWLLWKLPLV
jgi:hypothetical protein